MSSCVLGRVQNWLILSHVTLQILQNLSERINAIGLPLFLTTRHGSSRSQGKLRCHPRWNPPCSGRCLHCDPPRLTSRSSPTCSQQLKTTNGSCERWPPVCVMLLDLVLQEQLSRGFIRAGQSTMSRASVTSTRRSPPNHLLSLHARARGSRGMSQFEAATALASGLSKQQDPRCRY
jgi:hypothetical protein